ncbi:MATE family efflux transporter [Sinorhizobium fredii]|uniref:Multidrug resistance protein NorM 1 n=1 Tax=Rhizobium fredii TaxID=380 RepID=A0A2L0H6Q0_RHIFR|nr:MATE family efflux transporter [Sinorhizobium fredii]AUX76439.1 multidrug resistance protein NorM 1 [Sinorhizobium fredii]
MPAVSLSYPTFAQARRIGALAMPLSAVQLAQVAISTTDMIMLGWVGGTALAAGALGFTLFNLLRTMGFGLVVGTSNLVAENSRAGIFRAHLLAGLAIATGAAAIGALVLAFGGFLLLPWFGQDEDVSEFAARYLLFAAPGLFPLFWFYAYRGVVVGGRRANLLLLITLGTVVVNAVFDYGFLFGAFGLPALGVAGVAASSSISYLLQFVAIASVTHGTTRFIREKSAVEIGSALRRTLKIGVPTAGSYAFEAGFTTLIALMAGTYGAAALAAHAAVNQIIYVVFMLSIGLSHATSVGVSEAIGARDGAGALGAGRSGLCLGLAVVSAFSALLMLFPSEVLALFSIKPDGDAGLHEIATGLLFAAALFQIFDFLQNIGIGAVRGIGRAGQGFWITIGSYWIVGAPTAWLVGFHLYPGVLGVWIGMGAGLAAAATGMVLLFERGAAPAAVAEPAR